MIFTNVGYIAGFISGMLFGSDYIGPGDTTTGSYNNAWIIWITAFFVSILAATVWEVIYRHREKTE